jgi:hypothetical protein
MTEPVRAYLYRIALAVIPLLIAGGVISDTDAALWAGLVAAVFSSGLAVRHTSTHRGDVDAPEVGQRDGVALAVGAHHVQDAVDRLEPRYVGKAQGELSVDMVGLDHEDGV